MSFIVSNVSLFVTWTMSMTGPMRSQARPARVTAMLTPRSTTAMGMATSRFTWI